MSTWITSTEPYRDVPQNGLPHMHWPGDAEHGWLSDHDNDVRGCGAHVVSTQEHPAELRLGKPTLVPLYNTACRGQSGSAWQSAQHLAEVWRRAGDGLQRWLLRFNHLSCVQDQDGNQPWAALARGNPSCSAHGSTSEAGGTGRPLAPQSFVWLIGSVSWRLNGLREGAGSGT
jgi:hypothetical protein